MNDNTPASIGDINQDKTIFKIPSHFMESTPPYAKENPTIAPIIECVVDTGILIYDAK